MNVMHSARHRRRTGLGAIAVASALLLAACGGDSGDDAADATSVAATPATSAAATTAAAATSAAATESASPAESSPAATTGAPTASADAGSASATAGESPSEAASSPAAAADKSKKIVVGAANFGESEILANMYIGVLKKAGFTAELKKGDLNRETLSKALLAGEIHLTPEYVGTDTEYWNLAINGKDAPPKATSDPETTATALRELLAQKDLTAYEASPAADQNAFAVTKATAEKHGLTKMSDLAKVASTFTLGGPAECPTRPFCQPGLEKTYGAKFKAFKALDAGGPLTKNALADGNIDVGLVFSSDGGIPARGFVVLEDDKGLQTADNIIPVLRKEIDSPELKAPWTACPRSSRPRRCPSSTSRSTSTRLTPLTSRPSTWRTTVWPSPARPS
jgi:osmoprotectant transport system substrate-binding protein